MAIFTMSDLHLSFESNKPTEGFASAWDNYIRRIYENWHSTVTYGDTVIVGGDISWSMNLKDCVRDFEFINSLPGKKLLLKGNHDYWWESMTKLNDFVDRNRFDTIEFIHNASAVCEDSLISGSRLWSLPGDAGFGEDDRKIYQRELARLVLSFEDGRQKCEKLDFNPQKRICVLHYPPFTKSGDLDEEVLAVLKKYSVTHCVYGHLHSKSTHNAPEGLFDGIDFRLVSSDYLKFTPVKI